MFYNLIMTKIYHFHESLLQDLLIIYYQVNIVSYAQKNTSIIQVQKGTSYPQSTHNLRFIKVLKI